MDNRNDGPIMVDYNGDGTLTPVWKPTEAEQVEKAKQDGRIFCRLITFTFITIMSLIVYNAWVATLYDVCKAVK